MIFSHPIQTPRFKAENGFTTTPARSKIMSKIGSKDTQPEIKLRKALWKHGLRYRLHNTKLKGKPDIVIKSKMLVIFIDGDFWHGRNWEQKKTRIKTNREFWIAKIERNMQRDLETTAILEYDGWKVVRVWESDIKSNISGCIALIENAQNKVR
jgi:DNA mismatch endonuclease (patch repair protein)